MKKILLFASALAVLGLTACEKGLGDDIGGVGNGQVKNSVLQVRTRGASGDGATVVYPLQCMCSRVTSARHHKPSATKGRH